MDVNFLINVDKFIFRVTPVIDHDHYNTNHKSLENYVDDITIFDNILMKKNKFKAIMNLKDSEIKAGVTDPTEIRKVIQNTLNKLSTV